jgi:hypothetical protein
MIAIEGTDPNAKIPLSYEYSNENQALTVLNIPDKNSPRALGGDPKSDKILSAEQYRYKIFSRRYQTGENTIDFTLTEDKPCVSFLLFYSLDPMDRGVTCGGDEKIISNPAEHYFKNCT